MPLYTYKCKKSSFITKVKHSINETLEVCTECEEEGQMIKMLSRFSIEKSEALNDDNSKPGSVVKTSIEEFKKDLKSEKQKLKKAEYVP